MDSSSAPVVLVELIEVTRLVTISKFSEVSGFSKRAIETRIYRKSWPDGMVTKRKGRILIDLKAYKTWAEKKERGVS